MPRYMSLTAVFCVAFATLSLAADAPSVPPANFGPVRANLQLALWVPRDTPEAKATVQIVRAYQQLHPDVRINIRYHKDVDGYSTLQRWCGRHSIEATDLVVVADRWLDEISPSLVSLEPAVAADFSKPLRERLTQGGKLRAVPWVVNTSALLYRPDALAGKRKTPPATWDELAKEAAAATSKGRVWGLGLSADSAHATPLLLQLLWAEGGEAFSADGKLQLSTPELTAALSQLGKLLQAGGCQPEILAWTLPELTEAFAAGKLAMLLADRQTERELSRRGGAVKYQAARPPRGKHPVGIVTTTCLAVLDSTQQSAAATDFLRFVASPPAQRILADVADSVPCQTELMRSLGADPILHAYIEALQDAHPLPSISMNCDRLVTAYDLAVCEVAKGRYTPEEALKAARAALEAADKAALPPDAAPDDAKPGPQVE